MGSARAEGLKTKGAGEANSKKRRARGMPKREAPAGEPGSHQPKTKERASSKGTCYRIFDWNTIKT